MDIVRFLSASAFVKSPVPRLQAMHNLADGSSLFPPVHSMRDPATLLALGNALGAIGDGWNKAFKILFGSSSEKVIQKICLGFEKYAHSVRVIKAEGIPQEQFLYQVTSCLGSVRFKLKR